MRSSGSEAMADNVAVRSHSLLWLKLSETRVSGRLEGTCVISFQERSASKRPVLKLKSSISAILQ